LMPAGELVTVPVPVPLFVTERVKLLLWSVKEAPTEAVAFMVTWHAPVPVQAPLQPAKVEPDAGAAVRLTTVPELNDAEQVEPQLMPAGELVTVPVPVPLFVTERLKLLLWSVNDAPTDFAALIVTWHEPVPLQAPLQPAKVEPDAGAAVRLTTVPELNDAEQVEPQLIPAGELVTVPVPVPLFVTERVNGPEEVDWPLMIVKSSSTAPVSLRNLASRRLPLTSRTIDPSLPP
jgi:hypothetical protein